MPIIKTRVDQATYRKLVEKTKTEGLVSISALFLKNADMPIELQGPTRSCAAL